MQPKKLLLIDANALIHRAWHAIPPLSTKSGEMVNALYGFLLMLLKVLPAQKPDMVMAAFDLKAPTFRHKLFTPYKAQRAKQPDELYQQFPKIKEVLKALGICILEKEGFEADDIIGTMARWARQQKPPLHAVILTGDMDTLQLVDDTVHVLCFKKGVSETVLYDEAAVKSRYGLMPSQLVDYKALRGDPSDNLPGVKGIGEKTAAGLLQCYGTINGILKEFRKHSNAIPESVAAKLRSAGTDLELNQKLVTIDRDVDIDVDLGECTWPHYDRAAVIDLFRKYEFESLARRLPDDTAQPSSAAIRRATEGRPGSRATPAPQWHEIQTAEEVERLLGKTLAAKTVIASPVENGGLLLTAHDQQFVLASAALESFAVTLRPLGSDAVGWIGHDLKEVCKQLMAAGIASIHPSMDTMIGSYLLNPGARAHTLSNLAFTELHRDVPPAARGQQQLLAASGDSIHAAIERNSIIQELVPVVSKKLEEDKLTHLFETIELPLIPVLARMETSGIKVDIEYLNTLRQKLERSTQRLESDITTLAGEPFNINSPQQLQHILFTRLRLPTKGITKTKTGLSTAAEELDKLHDAHLIIPKLSEYRERTKLLNTYVDALPKLADNKTHRIHTTFNQTVAATGRLSSSDPNLQNIPIRTELGNEVRNCFVAERGCRLLSLDYNQIELRVVASLAQDKKMIDAFVRGEDIHTRTAAEIFGIPIERVTAEMRRTAKTVNFGVLYGLGATGLSQATELSRAQAKEFIERYFQIYSGVSAFMEKSVVQAREYGFVQTLFGRKRHLPDIHSTMPQLRSQAERMAGNMPIQGTAADIIKLAMIKIDAQLPKWSKEARMLLQVHDELVFEVPPGDVETVARHAAKTMETVIILDAPIVAHAKAGTRWGTMTPMETQ